jgi:hypothetical protein
MKTGGVHDLSCDLANFDEGVDFFLTTPAFIFGISLKDRKDSFPGIVNI